MEMKLKVTGTMIVRVVLVIEKLIKMIMKNNCNIIMNNNFNCKNYFNNVDSKIMEVNKYSEIYK